MLFEIGGIEIALIENHLCEVLHLRRAGIDGDIIDEDTSLIHLPGNWFCNAFAILTLEKPPMALKILILRVTKVMERTQDVYLLLIVRLVVCAICT